MKMLRRLYNLYIRKYKKFNYFGHGVCIEPVCDISSFAAPFIYIEKNVYIGAGVWLNIPTEALDMEPPIIKIGEGTQIGRRCSISGANSIRIGREVMFAPNIFVTDHLHQFGDRNKPIAMQGITETGKIVIEEGCWIGHGCAIIASKKKELVLGKNSIVAANSVVTKSFPDYSTIIGIPARNVGKMMHR